MTVQKEYDIVRRSTGRRKISNGIELRWNITSPFTIKTTRIWVSARLEVSGEAASQLIADTMKSAIESFWTNSFYDEKNNFYSIETKVDMCYRKDFVQEANRTQIFVTNEIGPSTADDYKIIRYRINSMYPITYLNPTIVHEFGHLLMLEDRYIEDEKSRKKRFEGKYSAQPRPMPGWKGNVMAAYNGKLERKNIDELINIHVPMEAIARGQSPETNTDQIHSVEKNIIHPGRITIID